MKLGKSTCKALFTDKNRQQELELNSTLTYKSTPVTQAPLNGEIPTREEVENNLRGIVPKGKEIVEEALKRAIELSFALEKRTLKSNWWEITKRKLVEWSKKG